MSRCVREALCLPAGRRLPAQCSRLAHWLQSQASWLQKKGGREKQQSSHSSIQRGVQESFGFYKSGAFSGRRWCAIDAALCLPADHRLPAQCSLLAHWLHCRASWLQKAGERNSRAAEQAQQESAGCAAELWFVQIGCVQREKVACNRRCSMPACWPSPAAQSSILARWTHGPRFRSKG